MQGNKGRIMFHPCNYLLSFMKYFDSNLQKMVRKREVFAISELSSSVTLQPSGWLSDHSALIWEISTKESIYYACERKVGHFCSYGSERCYSLILWSDCEKNSSCWIISTIERLRDDCEMFGWERYLQAQKIGGNMRDWFCLLSATSANILSSIRGWGVLF